MIESSESQVSTSRGGYEKIVFDKGLLLKNYQINLRKACIGELTEKDIDFGLRDSDYRSRMCALHHWDISTKIGRQAW